MPVRRTGAIRVDAGNCSRETLGVSLDVVDCASALNRLRRSSLVARRIEAALQPGTAICNL